MGDSALQQYATMHKNDPYILPMAIAESNVRKQMRLRAQAKMAMQPQPKVAEKKLLRCQRPHNCPNSKGLHNFLLQTFKLWPVAVLLRLPMAVTLRAEWALTNLCCVCLAVGTSLDIKAYQKP